MWDVHVFQRGVVVLVRVVGLQMTPVLPSMQVVGDVEVLVPMLHPLMLVMTLGSRHRAHPLSLPTLAEEPTVYRSMDAGQTEALPCLESK